MPFREMSGAESPILKPPSSRIHSRPSTPGASFLHTTSLKCPTKHSSSNTAEITRSLTPHALTSCPPSPVRKLRRHGEVDGESALASRSKTSLTLSLPEEETFGQPSIDLPGLNMGREFGFALGSGSRTSRIDEGGSVGVGVVEEGKMGGRENVEDVNNHDEDDDAHGRRTGDRVNRLGLEGDEPDAMKERRIAEMLDWQDDDEEEEENNGFRGLLRKIWGKVAGESCCCCGCS
ncbi:hypothetical protein NHQ30_006823 [Ciborinia camelliae]|nr:hypothetical protein NHQ30_006823 [Ciborinia camelliae]